MGRLAEQVAAATRLPRKLGWWPPCPRRAVAAIRHGEVVSGGGPNPPLSAAGQARAQELVHLFEADPPTKILVSALVRTQQTAAPLAGVLGLTPVVLDPLDVEGYVAQITALPQHSTVLAIGHSNTVPAIVGKLTGSTLADIPGDQFDRLYVAVGRRRLELRYGAASP